MPSSTVNRLLDEAAEFLAVAESGDAERSAYEHAALKIEEAMQDDPSLTQAEVGERIGKGRKYVARLLEALVLAREQGEFRIDWQSGSNRRTEVIVKTAAERPADFVAAYEQAPPAAQQEIAKRIVKSPAIRIEAARHTAEERANDRPTPVRKSEYGILLEFDSRLTSAYRSLREAHQLLSEVEQVGDDSTILARITQLKTLIEVIEESYRSGKSIDTWAAELWEEAR